MTDFISHLHTDIRRARQTLRGATHKPSDVPHFTHKTYARMARIALPEPKHTDVTLAQVFATRRSAGSGTPQGELTLDDLGGLFASLKTRPDGHRPYPSGGALCPIETYLAIRDIEGHHGGVFHYNPTEHALEFLWDMPANRTVKELAPKPDTLDFNALLIFTSVWKRSSAKYGDFTYGLALLEAGHMSQNILLSAAAGRIAARPMAGFHDERIISLLDLDERNEQPVHSVTLSRMPRNDSKQTLSED